MNKRRIVGLLCVLAVVAAAALASWMAGSRIESPAEAAARTAPPKPSPILVPVEKRVLSSNVVTRGTGRFGLPQSISIAPSALKPGAGLITTLPRINTQVKEGDSLLTTSGRPVLVLEGKLPAYRDLVLGLRGTDVRQLEVALQRLGFDPGPMDGFYDGQTSAAVEKWYESGEWKPFGPTPDQLAKVRAVELELAHATKAKLAADGTLAAAGMIVEAARAKAEHASRVAAIDLAMKNADKEHLLIGSVNEVPLAVQTARAKAEHANAAARADISAKIAERALIVLDPTQTRTARTAADAHLEVARAAALNTRLEGELVIRTAKRDANMAAGQHELAEAAIKAVSLEGEVTIQTAIETQKIATLEAEFAAKETARLQANLERVKSKLGVQVPIDEVVFIPSLPVRVEEVMALVGDPASGPVLSVTDNQLSIDSSLALDVASLVKPGMEVIIDERALGIKTKGVVERVAEAPGTNGVDGYHFYLLVSLGETIQPLNGVSLRLTMSIESTKGEVTAVPLSAVSLAADGSSRVQVSRAGKLQYVTVEPGLTADGYVEVAAVDGEIAPGDEVVIGY